jgi:MYXO-CTERM domain-containing protein
VPASPGGTYSSIGGATIAPAGGDEKLNTGFVFGNGTFTVSGVPYANYDVYVYELNDASGRVETTTLTAGGPAQTYYGSSATPNDSSHVDQSAGTSYVYVLSNSTNVGSPTTNGDYVQFTGLTGSTFTFTSTAPGNGYVNGFQIVPTPEPASLGFVGVSVLALLARRQRRVSPGTIA